MRLVHLFYASYLKSVLKYAMNCESWPGLLGSVTGDCENYTILRPLWSPLGVKLTRLTTQPQSHRTCESRSQPIAYAL